jgi:hypothetical protein
MILNDKGIPIFHYSFGVSSIDKYNYQLIASYFDQICQFTKYGFRESLNTLRMDKTVFYFYIHNLSNLKLIIKCDKKADDNKNMKKAIDKCASILFEKFLARFKIELKVFKGHITPFKLFSKELDSLIDSDGALKPSLLKQEVI